jgi:hypothetical protein
MLINDYVEGKVSKNHADFWNYIALNEQVKAFVFKSEQGKMALSRAFRVEAAPDFEEKMALRIAREKSTNR